MEIRARLAGGERVDAAFAGFVVRTDHSVEDGGEGSAPAPWHVFLASIATCVGAYVLGACQARDLATEGIEIVLRAEYDASGERLAKVKITIVVPPQIPQEHHEALVRAAELCAVKRAISNPPAFEIGTSSSS